MKTTQNIEKQIVLWNWLSIAAPVTATTGVFFIYIFNLFTIEILIYIASGLYFATAITWWYWTMNNIFLLTKIMQNSQKEIQFILEEIKQIKNELI